NGACLRIKLRTSGSVRCLPSPLNTVAFLLALAKAGALNKRARQSSALPIGLGRLGEVDTHEACLQIPVAAIVCLTFGADVHDIQIFRVHIQDRVGPVVNLAGVGWLLVAGRDGDVQHATWKDLKAIVLHSVVWGGL